MEDETTTSTVVATAAQMTALGRTLARWLRAGDLVLAHGELGAGKTTLVRGLGEGLGVRGAVTSPTFVIARVHPARTGGPPLVHVDAYRLGSLQELDDLDLDASLADSVTVVEWGEGKAEALSSDRLEVWIERAVGDERLSAPRPADAAEDGDVEDGGAGDDPRLVRIVGHGDRWAQGLPSLC